MLTNADRLRKQIKGLIIFFIIALALSGITAFPVETGLAWILSWWPEQTSGLYYWLDLCYKAMKDTNEQYPYLAYGYDWLAFAHLVIATAFVGPLRDPVRNIWIIEWGCLACMAVIPLAFIAAPIRHIPVYWTLIDCSFGVFGIVPLLICRKKIKLLEGEIVSRQVVMQ